MRVSTSAIHTPVASTASGYARTVSTPCGRILLKSPLLYTHEEAKKCLARVREVPLAPQRSNQKQSVIRRGAYMAIHLCLGSILHICRGIRCKCMDRPGCTCIPVHVLLTVHKTDNVKCIFSFHRWWFEHSAASEKGVPSSLSLAKVHATQPGAWHRPDWKNRPRQCRR